MLFCCFFFFSSFWGGGVKRTCIHTPLQHTHFDIYTLINTYFPYNKNSCLFQPSLLKFLMQEVSGNIDYGFSSSSLPHSTGMHIFGLLMVCQHQSLPFHKVVGCQVSMSTVYLICLLLGYYFLFFLAKAIDLHIPLLMKSDRTVVGWH